MNVGFWRHVFFVVKPSNEMDGQLVLNIIAFVIEIVSTTGQYLYPGMIKGYSTTSEDDLNCRYLDPSTLNIHTQSSDHNNEMVSTGDTY